MAVYQRGETYVHRIDIRNRNSVLTTPATIKENIYDQCGHWLLKSQSMSSDAIGKFYYNYAISSTATYGRYYSKVTATDAGGYVSVFKDEFFVLPWDAVQDVRQTMGLPEAKSVDDDTIANAVWNSYRYALHDVHTYHKSEQPLGNVTTGVLWDGTNTEFQTPYHPLADSGGDGMVGGSLLSCATDITGYWIDEDGHQHTAYIWVQNPENGEITIYASLGYTIIPATAQKVYLDYWEEAPLFNEYLFQQAVVRLACYELSKRFNSLNEITLQDIRSNNALVIIDPDLWMKEYKRYLHMSRGIIAGGV